MLDVTLFIMLTIMTIIIIGIIILDMNWVISRV